MKFVLGLMLVAAVSARADVKKVTLDSWSNTATGHGNYSSDSIREAEGKLREREAGLRKLCQSAAERKNWRWELDLKERDRKTFFYNNQYGWVTHIYWSATCYGFTY